jgi:HAD superfamily hydrolase (TIGR01490 family)
VGNIGAFFDIDGTLFRNSLMIEHFKKMIKYEVMDPVIWYGNLKDSYSKWENRYGDFEVYLEELADIYVKELKGMNKDYIEFIASQVININGDKVYKYTRSRVEWHKENGHKIFFISGAPDFLVEKMSLKYEATEYKATEYLVDGNNNFTGEIIKMWDSENKQRVLNKLVNKFEVELESSFAYGDTTGDLSMFQMVGNPIAVNPNRNLLMSIKDDQKLRDKTRIIVERKDLIYELSPDIDILTV